MWTLTGTLAHEQVLERFQQADCFVLGCKVAGSGDRDGIPNVLAESMALGVPVIGTRVSGIPELVEHEQTGLLVDATRPEELAAP
jgi:glycosyltransferase involved in cell wall biosynthesis